jgi:hypothetical protein
VTNTGPWECTLALARQVWDTSRHVDIFLKLLKQVESDSGTYPEIIAETASAELASAILAQLIELAQTMGDADVERALDFVRAETNTRGRKDQANAIA